MAPQKLSDANLESILWNKVPVKLQKEVYQMSEGSLQELFQKLLKAEETVKERERRFNYKGSEGREFQSKFKRSSYRYDGKANYPQSCQESDSTSMSTVKCGKKGHLASV